MTVTEKETVVGEKILETKEEVVVDPITGDSTVQTFEYVEKTIEKEVCYENENEDRTQFFPSLAPTFFICNFIFFWHRMSDV